MATQVGGIFVRIRPSLSPEDAEGLEQLATTARDLADALDRFRDQFVVAPAAAAERNEEVPGVAPLRLALERGDTT